MPKLFYGSAGTQLALLFFVPRCSATESRCLLFDGSETELQGLIYIRDDILDLL